MRSSLLPLLLLALGACVRNPRPAAAPEPVVIAAPAAPVAVTAKNAAEMLRARELMVPVAGVRTDQLRDTYNEARSGGRTHRALDILAPRGTAVLAADDGVVYRVRHNTLGGLTVYALDATGSFVYYYAHLDRYAAQLAEGMPLAKGDVIGYVGTTGNAPRDTPHLHFQVMRLEDVKRYWDGPPVDSRPYFALDGRPNGTDRQGTR